MSQARFTLTLPDLTHDQAFAMMETIDNDARLDPLAVTINETDEALGHWETLAWFETLALAEQAKADFGEHNAVISPVPDKDWVKLSLEGLAPVTAGRFFLHGAHDRDKRPGGGIALEIDAGTAFGTGHHGTTAGCLEAFDTIIRAFAPRRILDLGCGTGVLAIAAAKTLKRSVTATDIDPEAVRVTRLNAALNGVKPLITAATAPGLHSPVFTNDAHFDLIFANILARPLASLAQGLSAILAPRGHLILSGLTVDQQRWITACYVSRGLQKKRAIKKGNWLTLVFTNPIKNKRPAKTVGRIIQGQDGPGWADD